MISVKGHMKNGKYVHSYQRKSPSPKTPIEEYWDSPLSKNDMSVPYQKMAKKNMDEHPEVVKLMMDVL